MTVQELQTRLEKAQETVTKKESLLVKYQKKWCDAYASIIAKGYDPDGGRYQCDGTSKHDDCYWSFCDLDDVEERIEATTKAIIKAKKTAEKWAVKLDAEKAKEKEKRLFPEVLREYQYYLVRVWDEYDMNRREKLIEEYASSSWMEFLRCHSKSEYDLMNSDFDSIHKENMRSAENSVFNLWQRVKDIVGDVISYDLHMAQGNWMEGSAINGTVKGTNGWAEVHTIGAGGYNIQRFHFRVLVHKM